MILAGCPPQPVAWALVVPCLIYTALAIRAFIHPELVHTDYARKARLLATLMILVGLVLTFSLVYAAVTGHCLGTNVDSS